MDRNDVVGKRIARVLRSPFEEWKVEIHLPGISTGLFTHFRLFFEFEDGSIMRVGSNRQFDPLRIEAFTPAERGILVDFEFDAELKPCVGESIAEALASGCGDIFLFLSSGRYLWFTDEVNGMAMYLYDETWFTEDGPTSALEMFTYWGDAKTDYGGKRFLR